VPAKLLHTFANMYLPYQNSGQQLLDARFVNKMSQKLKFRWPADETVMPQEMVLFYHVTHKPV